MTWRHRTLTLAGRATLAWVLAAALGAPPPAAAGETERLYLSGHGPDDARPWEFRIDSGRRAGVWTTIPVPSQWELAGFGRYTYGQNDARHSEVGSYRLRFEAPAEWRGRAIELVFEGVMTDAEVRLNGELLGRHRGGFTRFRFPVGLRLALGGENVLAVEVAEASADRSVEAAERRADYWTFGGIYRPVYLEARPSPGIADVAIAARDDGSVRALIEVGEAAGGAIVRARVLTAGGAPVGPLAASGAVPPSGEVELAGRFRSIVPWSAERPVLYVLEVELARGGETHHQVRRRFGFRSVELRPGVGLFVNGRRTLLKGINRHALRAISGRALTRDQNRDDVRLIKELNANAVRSSHYPPDVAFLEACDELGLYVIDELPGWHDAYGTRVGRRLVAEMVRRDRNHPSVILWANGNEGGWNRRLDAEFGRYDLERRPVIHPGAVFGGVDARHYPSWAELDTRLAAEPPASLPGRWTKPATLVLPTEMLHGLYDGGLGAGLEDFWRLVRAAPRAAGGFLWALGDEAVVRTDRGGRLDAHGSYGPDGIVAPNGTREASFATVRAVWSPVVPVAAEPIGSGALRVEIENRYDTTALDAATFAWRALAWPGPDDAGGERELARGELAAPAVAPGARGTLVVPGDDSADAVDVSVIDAAGRLVDRWVLPVAERSWVPPKAASNGEPRSLATADALARLGLGQQVLPAANTVRHAFSEGADGWLRLELEASANGALLGVAFAAPVERLRRVEWLGHGPHPVWANRLAGPSLGVWSGRPAPGFYGGVRWARLEFGGDVLTVVAEGGGELVASLSAPSFPADARDARAPVPPGESIGFFLAIPPIGSKFHPGEALMAPSGAGVSRLGAASAVWLRREPAR